VKSRVQIVVTRVGAGLLRAAPGQLQPLSVLVPLHLGRRYADHLAAECHGIAVLRNLGFK